MLREKRCLSSLSHSSLLFSSSHKKPRMLAAHSSSAVIYPVESVPVLGGCINCCAQRFGRPPTMWGRCTPITLHAPCITLEPPLNYSRDPILLQIAVGPPPSPPNLLCYYTDLMDGRSTSGEFISPNSTITVLLLLFLLSCVVQRLLFCVFLTFL